MRIKLDENIAKRAVDLLRANGHEVTTVRGESLSGAPDEVIFRVCVDEGRTLVTLDRDFGHVTRFPPRGSAGIVILELGGPA